MPEFSLLLNIILYTFIASVGSLIGGAILLSKEKLALKISHLLASFAAGTLLGTAFFDLLPEAAEQAEKSNTDIFLWTGFGVIGFFLLERFIHWFHHHEDFHGEESKDTAALPLLIIGDTLHNFLDGVVIGATFMVNPSIGIVTAFAVAAHEIPQEIGDFGLMIHMGLKKRKIILINILSACASLIGSLITVFVGVAIAADLSIFLSLTAGFFIYIALSDLIPEIYHEKRKGFAFYESMLLLLGAGLIYTFVTLLEKSH